MKDKIVEILIDELCKELTEDGRVKNTNDFYHKAANRIHALYTPDISEEDADNFAWIVAKEHEKDPEDQICLHDDALDVLLGFLDYINNK